MSYRPPRSWIEQAAIRLRVLRETAPEAKPGDVPQHETLAKFPAADHWDEYVELDPRGGSKARPLGTYRLVPTVCFNCESACGLLAYVDKQTGRVRKFEGNPVHPGSRGRNCAKGPATINQVNDPDRILTPMKREGPRGSGKWRSVSWDEALRDIGGRIRNALQENRHNEVVYHVGRPGSEGFVDRVLRAWGVDGHNSHTNICSAGARFGYAIWSGYDRPSPDYANARFILALNAHLESGHYFNPHAQRISEGIKNGAQVCVVDPRLSNTASMAHYWLPTKPGTEAALLLAIAHVLLREKLINRAFVERWVNWRDSLSAMNAEGGDFDAFFERMELEYARFTPEYAAEECGLDAAQIVHVARKVGEAGERFCSHTWRGAASAHLGGWQVARCLFFLHVLTGSVGTRGGCSPSAWSKYKADLINMPPPQKTWNELHWPREYPLAHYEMSELLPHFLKDCRGKIDVYFTRVFNPVWTYPDGFSWIEALSDESKIGLHIALTPTWNESALYADYVLPMGHGPERHDLTTYETHAGTWIAFRQPVLRAHRRAEGTNDADTRDANPGQVWEEDEFWIALTWAIDPDGSLGIRKYFESPRDSSTPLTVDDYYTHILERVPGLKDKAASEKLAPLDYMRRYGAFEVRDKTYQRHERRLSEKELENTQTDAASGLITRNGARVGVMIDGAALEGFPTPSGKLEFYSRTTADWGWPEHAIPGYIPSHIWESPVASEKWEAWSGRPGAAANDTPGVGDFCLLPTFRLPTLIHTRSGAAKWLNEISQRNPVWIHTSDAKTLGVSDGDLVRVSTTIGHFVDRCWVTEAIRPGVVACSHHLGRWRRPNDPPASRWSGNVVTIEEAGGVWRMKTRSGPGPFDSADSDSRRVWWREGGVHQNLIFPAHPDPISGMHCWHQRVRVEKAHAGDEYGDVVVDTNRSMEVYREWLALARPATGELRRPLWMNRPLRPTDEAYRL
ncbi:MAG: molybdopterin-dependent oxidoreductase [Phycisphaerales bacterium]|nr:molybdopterin-dependent oxidoreductase [Phycisphaerales bacterium]